MRCGSLHLSATAILPEDKYAGALVGRVWLPTAAGPSVVAIRQDGCYDITSSYPTVASLAEERDPAAGLRAAKGIRIDDLDSIAANTPLDLRDATRPWLLTPVDLQVIKAAGVTFVVSMLERVIEERARGNPSAAAAIRDEIERLVGNDLSKLKPGSPEALRLKNVLIEQRAWSQYLEVGIGVDAEVFTKAPVLSAIGTGMDAGFHPKSIWNNPEPEVVLVVSGSGRIVGAALGNDVNLRDFEGRSALLLSKAKDNTGSCAIGPFVRFFDDAFTLDDVRTIDVTLKVEGEDGFLLEGMSSIRMISRDPADLVQQTVGPNHQYPDGFVLFLGTMFAPTQDREGRGEGFTHKIGDIVHITSPKFGALINRMRTSDTCERWSFGLGALMKNLAERGFLSLSKEC